MSAKSQTSRSGGRHRAGANTRTSYYPATIGAMPATRLMPTEEGQDLIDLTRQICDKELRPLVDEAERAAATVPQHPQEAFRTLGRAGLLSLPYAEELGGGAQPYEVYL